MNAEIKGTLLEKNETQTFGDKGFRVRTFVVQTDEQYSQEVEIKTVQDKTELIDAFEVGKSIKVQVNLKSRTWVDPKGVKKYFSSFEGWRIEANTDAPGASNEPQAAPAASNTVEDDLPF